MKQSLLSVVMLLVAGVASAAVTEPVKTDAGLVSGVAGNNADVRVFKGIPFAAPPVGPLRWKAPQPAAKWDGVRKARGVRSALHAGRWRRRPRRRTSASADQ